MDIAKYIVAFVVTYGFGRCTIAGFDHTQTSVQRPRRSGPVD